MTNWQTNIFHSSSSSVLFFFFLDNPHNNLTGECMTTQCSPLLSVDSVQRTGGYQRSNTPHSLKKMCWIHSRELSKHHKRSEYRFNYFSLCAYARVQDWVTTLRPFACSRKVMFCQSLPEDRLSYRLCFNRWVGWLSLNPSEPVSITGSIRGG